MVSLLGSFRDGLSAEPRLNCGSNECSVERGDTILAEFSWMRGLLWKPFGISIVFAGGTP